MERALRRVQVVWFGAKYAITDNLDIIGAYYHYDQNTFTIASCANAPAHAQRAGTMDAASVVIDWRFLPKWDTYIGTFFSQMNGRLDNGFLSRSNLATTAGLRFRFLPLLRDRNDHLASALSNSCSSTGDRCERR